MWGNSETIVEIIYGESLSIVIMEVWSPSLEIGRSKDYPWNGSTSQVIGDGNGLPLTHNGEGEEIV